MHARFRVLKTKAAGERHVHRFQLSSNQETMRADYLPATPKQKRVPRTTTYGLFPYQTGLDFSRVPVETETTPVVRQVLHNNRPPRGLLSADSSSPLPRGRGWRATGNCYRRGDLTTSRTLSFSHRSGRHDGEGPRDHAGGGADGSYCDVQLDQSTGRLQVRVPLAMAR